MALADDVNALPTGALAGTTGINDHAVVTHLALKDLVKLLGSTPFGASLAKASDAAGLRNIIGAPTRTGVFQFDHPNNVLSFGSVLTVNTRKLFSIPFDVQRFRVHWRNRNFLADADVQNQTIAGFKAFMGESAPGTDAPSAAFAAAPVQILASTTLVGGTEKVSPWIAPSTFTIQKNKVYTLSEGCNLASTDQVAVGGGGHFVSVDGDKAGLQAANTATFTPNQSIFDTWIEYEYVEDDAPSILVVSNSTSGPGNSASAMNRGDRDTWLHQWEMANRGVAASIAVAGSWAANYPANSPKWNHYDTLATPIVYDAVVLMALMSSDIAGGSGDSTAIAAAKSSMGVVINKARSLYPKARIIVTTNPPRTESTGAKETARLDANAWLSSAPYGVDQCFDIDMILRNTATTPPSLKTEFDSGDHTHWSPRGHAAVANRIPVAAKTR